jgi:hypothetical protein
MHHIFRFYDFFTLLLTIGAIENLTILEEIKIALQIGNEISATRIGYDDETFTWGLCKIPCNMSKEIASILILTAAQKQQVPDNPTLLSKNVIPDHVENYKQDQQLLINLHAELAESQKDNSDYASRIADLEQDLPSANTTICMLQAVANHTSLLIAKPIELPHPPEVSGDCKELLNFISKVRSKLAGESSCYIDDQHKLCYIYSFLKGNAQNQIQPYVLPDKIKLENVESLISILEAAFGNPD